ncbi:serine/threonine-protein phosphatase 5 [Thraustotheca clavata]|uniref:Serine/threonine-protein phosphatase n=1 Tax=Thraustotheca clavata TaxID=74557 RepID=A0A1V9ZQF8_9STRA|nr:serine/threonine-protein phosphatase 5 [Thraustotheca clavata]
MESKRHPAAVAIGASHIPSEATRERAEGFKNQGNEALKEHKLALAVEYYTTAIELYPTAIYHANRAAAHIKMESYGSALKDATEAISLDPAYIKAYYRRASANLPLGHLKDALRDYRTVVKMKPSSAEAKSKLKLCEQLIRQAAFADAIQSERNRPLSETIDVNSMVVDATYDGPHLPQTLTSEFMVQVLDHFKRGKLLHRKYVIQILVAIKTLFASLPSLLRIPLEKHENARITVCGDTHGIHTQRQFYDVCNIFEMNGLPSEKNPYLFNGDFVDRGSFSLEVVLTLFIMKLTFPRHVHLLRGNHESKNMNKIYGFEGEVKHKYDDVVMTLFSEVFNWLPLAACIEEKVVVVHGGLFHQDGVTLADIEKINRNREPPEAGLMSDLMWSDPQPFPGRGPSKRGIGLSFGPDITKAFLAHNNLVRSHEVKDEGYLVEHDEKCITVFSAPNYCDQMGNKGAFIHFYKDLKPKFKQFTAVEHPPIRPMAYAGNMGGLFGL